MVAFFVGVFVFGGLLSLGIYAGNHHGLQEIAHNRNWGGWLLVAILTGPLVLLVLSQQSLKARSPV